MPDPDIPASTESVDDFVARYRQHEARAAELHPANKASLFAALRAADIVAVVVRFDGYGDSGQIEEICAHGADNAERDVPATAVDLQRLTFGEESPVQLTLPLNDAIETMAYALLENTHGGWENNEGAYGDFLFDVSTGVITLSFHQRYEASDLSTHTF